ncbi:MAG: D-aminoacyl-tRNA deacylase [Flavobacteriaceae bacterium]
MKAMVQRVKQAHVAVDGDLKGEIGPGLLIFLGISTGDSIKEVQQLSRKIGHLRIFADDNRVMNLDVKQVQGGILVISQFTLHALTKKGNRPSFIKAAPANQARPLYEEFIRALHMETGVEVAEGVFGADMSVSLINDGPVTIILDTEDY